MKVTAILPLIFPLILCSCGVYELATTKDQDSSEATAVAVGTDPVIAIAGTHAFDEPSEREKYERLPDYERAIRNRNSGKATSENARFTILAMKYCYPLIADKTEGEVVKLLGPPDERFIHNGLIKYVYRIKGLKDHDEPALYLNPS